MQSFLEQRLLKLFIVTLPEIKTPLVHTAGVGTDFSVFFVLFEIREDISRSICALDNQSGREGVDSSS